MSYTEESVYVDDYPCKDYDGEEKETSFLWFKKTKRTRCSKEEHCANAVTVNIDHSTYKDCRGLIEKYLSAKQYKKHIRS